MTYATVTLNCAHRYADTAAMKLAALLALLAIGCATPPRPAPELPCAEALARAGVGPDRAVVTCAGRR